MIAIFRKYGLAIFVLLAILVKVVFLASIVSVLLYGVIGIGLLLIISQKGVFKNMSNVMVGVLIVTLSYWVVIEPYNMQSLQYLIGRVSSFAIISICLYSNFDYYKKDFPKILLNILLIVLIASVIFVTPSLNDRYKGILFNANDVGYLALIGVVLLDYTSLSRNKKYFIILGFLCFCILASGSRGALGALVLFYIFTSNFSFKKIMGLTVILVGLFYLGQNSDFSALKRLKRDESNLFDNREEAHYFAKKLIEQNYWFGSGLDAYNGVDSNNPIYRGHTEIGPHNSYYAFLIAYGVPLGSALSFFIIFTVLRYVYLIRVKKEFYISNKILFIPFLLILVSFTETFLTGINEVITLFFWYFLNLIYLEYRNSKQIQLTKNEKHPYIRESRGNVSVGAAVGSL